MKDVAEWWPQLHKQIRRALVNDIWMPVSDSARTEIEQFGGPEAVGNFWKLQDGDRYLPQSAVQWNIKTDDFKRFRDCPSARSSAPRAALVVRGRRLTRLGR